MIRIMTSDQMAPHEAQGALILTAVHFGGDAVGGLDSIMSLRWRDSKSAGHGQSSHVRLALYLERGGAIFVEGDGETLSVEVAADARFLHTQGPHEEAADPILRLPTY